MKNLSTLIVLFSLNFSALAEDPHFELATELYQQKNYLEAFRAFQVLAKRGDPKAQTVTALMYRFGEGVNQDLESAFNWYRKAAIQGYPPAQFHVGSMLADGIGTRADPEQGIKWLSIAHENGYSRAKEKLDQLSALTPITSQSNDGWLTEWDLRLPNDIRFEEAEPIESDASYMAQVGAMQTQAAANQLWKVLIDSHPKLFATLQPTIKSIESNDRRVYQVRTGPFSNLRDVSNFCQQLLGRTRQAGCLPIKQP